MMDRLNRFWHSLGDAEYLHLLLEPLPFYGCLFGLIFFAAAFKNVKMRSVALIIIGVSCLAYFPYLQQRQASTTEIASFYGGHPAIEASTSARQSEQWIYYVTAALCLLALVVRKGKLGPLLVATSVVGAVASMLFSGMAHLRDAETFHPNVAAEPTTAVKIPVTLGQSDPPKAAE